MNRVLRVFNVETYQKQSVFPTRVNVKAVSISMDNAALGILVCTWYTLAT